MNARITVPAGLLAMLLAAAPALGEDRNLPGVSRPEPVVTAPPPEPTDGDKDPRSFRIGNTEVRISGQITIDVTAGDIKSSLRR